MSVRRLRGSYSVSDVIAVVFIILGVSLSLAGIIMMLSRERVARSLSQLGASSSHGASLAYATSIGIVQIILGVFLIGLSVVLPQRRSAGQFTTLIGAISSALGSWAFITACGVALLGLMGLVAGVALIRSGWRRRELWSSSPNSSALRIPLRDRLQIGGGGFVAAIGGASLAFGVVLLAAVLF